MQRAKQDAFQYAVTFNASTVVGTNDVQTLTFLADEEFTWTHGIAHIVITASGVPLVMGNQSFTAAGGVPSCPFLLEIFDSGKSRSLMNTPVPLDVLFRVPTFSGPRELPFPRSISGRTTWRFTLTRQFAGQIDNAGATVTPSLTVRLTLDGFKTAA